MGFEKLTLEKFRQEVAAPQGEELAAMLDEFEAQGARLGKPDLKRVPAPFDKDHPRAELLKYKGLTVWRDFECAGYTTVYHRDGSSSTNQFEDGRLVEITADR